MPNFLPNFDIEVEKNMILPNRKRNNEDVKLLTIKLHKEKEEVKKNMTLKREKRKENVTRKLLEQVMKNFDTYGGNLIKEI